MSGSVQEVEGIFLAVLSIFHLHGVALDGDALLLLQIHRIQHLSLHLAAGYRIRCLQHPVRKRGFAVIYMCNYAKVPDIFHRDAKITKFEISIKPINSLLCQISKD